jgi:FkbM family methyltransferase
MLYRAVRRFNIGRALIGREPFYLADRRIATEFHGSKYGGWSVCQHSLHPGSIVYSIGIGQDVSFDLSLIAKHGCKIHAYDPTPQSVQWVAQHVQEPLFHMTPTALAAFDGTIKLYLPTSLSTDDVSASAFNLQENSQTSKHGVVDKSELFFEAPCRTLSSLMQENGHDYCDLVKMDVEGVEYDVLQQICDQGLVRSIGQLLVEFHHYFPGLEASSTQHAIRVLKECGFGIAWISRTNREYLFVRK